MPDALSQYALAYALTTTAGVRGLLSLAAVAVAAHFGLLHPPDPFAWLASPTAMWILIAISGVEIVADKIPVVDHAMHFVQVATKPAAAAILVGGTLHAPSHEVLIGLMILGALNALGVHAAIASVRGASTLATGGLGNPVVSTVEDAGSLGSIGLAFAAPFVAAVLAVGFTVALVWLARSAFRKVRAQAQR
jgi:hypothetical protein